VDSVTATGYAGYKGSEVALMLEEIKMAPLLFRRIMYRSLLATQGTRKGTSFGKVEEKIELLFHMIKLDLYYLPRPLKTQCPIKHIFCHTH
jgi:hypothetical protein